MKKKIIMCLLVVFLIGGGIAPFSLFSQNESVAEESNTEKTHRIFQLSFFYPLSTNWTNAINISNSISLNILIGVNGGVNGFEAGGVNFNRGDVLGFQAAYLLNINKGNSTGLVTSGLGNVLIGDGKGLFLASVFNVHTGSVVGFQASVVNYAKNMHGFQASVVNYAKKIKGFQLGVVNIIEDGKDAIPLGLLNIVIKNGYRAVDIYAGDLFYGNASFKMGVERLYTIFRAGYTTQDQNSIYAIGLGLGTIVPLTEKHRISVDAIFGNVTNDAFDAFAFNYELSVQYRYALTSYLELFAGPSFNFLHPMDGGKEVDEDYRISPLYSIVSGNDNDDRDMKDYYFWIGGNIGVSFRF